MTIFFVEIHDVKAGIGDLGLAIRSGNYELDVYIMGKIDFTQSAMEESSEVAQSI